MAHAASSDESLLAAFVRGDRAALGELASRYEKALLGLACGLLGGREDLARDAIQETWVRVIRFAGSFRGDSSFKTWVYRIAVNQCRSIRGLREVTIESEQLDGRPERDRSACREPVLRHELNGTLRTAMEGLSQEKQDVLLLCYHAGMTHEVAADVLGIPKGTLKSRLHASLTELRERLAGEATP